MELKFDTSGDVTDIVVKEPIVNTNVVIEHVLIPQRLDHESFSDYKIRRKEGNKISRNYKHGAPVVFWNSNEQKTFTKAKSL